MRAATAAAPAGAPAGLRRTGALGSVWEAGTARAVEGQAAATTRPADCPAAPGGAPLASGGAPCAQALAKESQVPRAWRRRRPTGCARRRATASARCCGSGPAAARRAAPAWPPRRTRPCAPARPRSAAGSSPRARRPPAGRSRCGGSAPPGLRAAPPAAAAAQCMLPLQQPLHARQWSVEVSVLCFGIPLLHLVCFLRYQSVHRTRIPRNSMQPHITRSLAQIHAEQWRGYDVSTGAHAQLSKQL